MGGAGDPRVCGCWQPGLPAPRPATEGTSYSFILGDSARPQSPGSLSQGAGAGGGRPSRPAAPAHPLGLRGVGRGAGSLVWTDVPLPRPAGCCGRPAASLCPAGHRRRAPCPACVSQAKLGGQEPCSHGNGTTQTPCPALLRALPSRCLSLCGPPGALARAQLRSGQTRTRPRPPRDLSWAAADGARGALEPWGPLTCSWHSGLRGSRVLRALSSAMCPSFSPAACPWGPGRGPAQKLAP